jgi:acetyl-CoA carboxylase biotin carboxyl carrier protein
MDLKLIQRLIVMMKRGGLAELDLEDSAAGLKVRLKREGEKAAAAPAPMVHFVQGGAPQGMMSAPATAATPGAAAGPAEAAAKPVPQGTPITSPMVGTFYRAASPEAEPFVSVGKRLQVGAPLCIIEAMKVMNEIKAEISGEVLEILVENGEPVEFGQPLFLVKTS